MVWQTSNLPDLPDLFCGVHQATLSQLVPALQVDREWVFGDFQLSRDHLSHRYCATTWHIDIPKIQYPNNCGAALV